MNRIGMVGGEGIGGKSSPPHDDAHTYTKAKNFWEEATSTIEIERRTSLVGVTSTSLVRLPRRFIIDHNPRCVQEQKQVQQQRLQPTRSMPALRCRPVLDFLVDARPLQCFFCFKRSSLGQRTTHRRLVLLNSDRPISTARIITKRQMVSALERTCLHSNSPPV